MRTNRKLSAPAVVSSLEKHILVDGFRIVIDLKQSRGPFLFDEG
jgi:hypothetical protein